MRYFLMSLFLAAVDLSSKEAVKKYIPAGKKKQLGNRLYLWHIKNKGLAYNKFDDRRKVVLASSSAATCAVALYLIHLLKIGAKPLDKIGAALILGGGMGNLAERIKKGEVTDFIYIKAGKLPIFNIADMFAAAGGLIVVIRSLFR